MSEANYPAVIGAVARELCGEPNAKLSSKRELRYGAKGSLSIDLEKGTWFDNESKEGGGVLDLVIRERGVVGRSEARLWLLDQRFIQPNSDNAPPSPATYVYLDERGEPVSRAVRSYDRGVRKFWQERALPGGKWQGGKGAMDGVRRIPYRLPELLAAPADELVFVVEGEKDVDNLRALGFVATCNAEGAEKWRACHAEFLKGRDVVILPDNDEPGRRHAAQVRESLAGIARSIRTLELPNLPAKGDVSDWIDGGGTADALRALLPKPEKIESPLKPISLASVMTAGNDPWPHVIEFYFPRRVVTLLGGHGGVGKSMLALILAAHVAAGRDWGPLSVSKGRTVFLTFEDEGSIVLRRLRRIIEAYQMRPFDVLTQLAVFDGSDADAELARESDDGRALEFTPMMGLVSEAVRDASLVVIDNASDTYGGNEVTRRQVKAFIRRLQQDARDNDAAVVLLAHVDKQAAKGAGKGNNYSGSTAWHNSVKSRLALVESEDGAIELLHEKANHGPRHAPINLQRDDHGVLSPIRPEVAAAARASNQALLAQADNAAVFAVIEALVGRVDIPTAETGQRTTYHVLCQAPELPAQYRSPAGKARVKAALMALERSGRIVREEVRTPDRKTKQRWTLAHFAIQKAA